MEMRRKTRQKSCVLCASAKRRCDLRSPKCSRCQAKGWNCEYKSAPPPSGSRLEPSSSEPHDFNRTREVPDMLQAEPEPNHLPLNAYSTPQFSELSLINADTPIDESFFNSYDARLTSYPRVGVMDRDRIKFLVSQLKSYTAKLFQTSRTPFIHPHLLSLSIHPVLQDAISASVLYASKNQHNEAMVWEIISSKASTLLREAQNSWSLSMHLACVQALIIFQIIRIFDGDIRQRSDAEMTESTLVEWTSSLSARTNIVTSPPTDSAASWET